MKKFNFKNPRTLTILVSAFIIVVLISGFVFGICTKYSKNNTKEAETKYVSKESETKKNNSEKSLVPNIESSTEQTTEEITTKSKSEENTTEEASSEEIVDSDNEITNSNNENNYNDNNYNENNYSDNSSSNNDAYQSDNNTNNSGNDDSDNSFSYEPPYTPPSNNDIAEPQAHIVYKEDGTWDLQNTYFDNIKAQIGAGIPSGVMETNEYKEFEKNNNLDTYKMQSSLTGVSKNSPVYISNYLFLITNIDGSKVKCRYDRNTNSFYIIN